MLERLEATMLNGLGSLEHLLVNDNDITWLEDGAFESLTALIRLHLQHNLLSEIQSNVFTNSLARLSELCLQNNLIRRLESGVFDNLVGLEKL